MKRKTWVDILILLLLVFSDLSIAQIVQKKNNTTIVESKKTNSSPSKSADINVLTLKIFSNTDCNLYVDGELKGELKQDVVKKIPLKRGDYLIKAVAKLDSRDVYTETYTVEETGLEKMFEINLRGVVENRLKEQREKAKILIEEGDKNNMAENPAVALENFTNAIKLDPSNSQIYLKAAGCLSQLKRQEEAIKMYDIAIEYSPSDPTGYRRRAYIFKTLKKYDNALTDDNKVISLAPTDGRSYMGRAYTYKLTGKYLEAIKDYDKGLELNPKEYMKPALYANRGYCKCFLKDTVGCWADALKVIESQQNNGKEAILLENAYYMQGWVNNLKGNYTGAITYFEKSVALCPADDEELKANLAEQLKIAKEGLNKK